MNIIGPLNAQAMKFAILVRVTLSPTMIYRFATTPKSITIASIDSAPFEGVGSLIGVGDTQSDIKATSYEQSATFVGIDTALLSWVLNQPIKSSKVEMWYIFFDANNNLTPPNTAYQFHSGICNNASITETWFEEARSFVGVINITSSSIEILLQNRKAGRFTNDQSWRTAINSDPLDSSMSRIGILEALNLPFGKD